MNFSGKIIALRGSLAIDRQRWRELCKDHPNLAVIPSTSRPNPFKPGQMMTIRAPDDSVRVIVSGCDCGTMEWASDESASINVWGKSDAIVPIARLIAQTLSAAFVEDVDDSGTESQPKSL